ncbi:MAG: YraN family protein [Chloroflexi bacterium]|nr:YraN family protein [Chloroflexota bacterium]
MSAGRWVNGVWQPPDWLEGARQTQQRREHQASASTAGIAGRERTGKQGEDRAVKHLKRLGYKILERNWRTNEGELDIVASEREELVFVEVRTLATERYGTPEESVGARKQRQLTNLATAYIQKRRHEGPWRIDVIAIDNEGLRHLKHAVGEW